MNLPILFATILTSAFFMRAEMGSLSFLGDLYQQFEVFCPEFESGWEYEWKASQNQGTLAKFADPAHAAGVG